MCRLSVSQIATRLHPAACDRYRDSKLTRMLQDSLGGNSHAVMVVNINSLKVNFQDTYHSLTFASKSKNSMSLGNGPRTGRLFSPPPPPQFLQLICDGPPVAERSFP